MSARSPLARAHRAALLPAVGLVVLLCVGCSGGAREPLPNYDSPARIAKMEETLRAGRAVHVHDFTMRYRSGALILHEREGTDTFSIFLVLFFLVFTISLPAVVVKEGSPVYGAGLFVVIAAIAVWILYAQTQRTHAEFAVRDGRVTIEETRFWGLMHRTHTANLRVEGLFYSRCTYDPGDDEESPSESCYLGVSWRDQSDHERYQFWGRSTSPGPRGKRMKVESNELCVLFGRVMNTVCSCTYEGRPVAGFSPGKQSPVQLDRAAASDQDAKE